MTRRYRVSPDGNDSTGDGSYLTPFATIARAATEAETTPVDEIELAEGTIVETVALTGPLGFNVIRGRGQDRSVVGIDLSGAWISLGSSDEPRLLIVDLNPRVLADDGVLVDVNADDASEGSVVIARCRIALVGEEATLVSYAGLDPQTVIPALQVDLLHCVVEGASDAATGYAIAGTASPTAAIAARNCVFTGLLAVNKPGTRPFDSDGNLFYGNDRDLTLGAYGTWDLRDTDPLFVAGGIIPDISSPLREAGVDLSSGYGWPARVPSADVGLTFPGAAPTIGAVEPVAASARTTVTTTDIHLLLAATASEVDIWDAGTATALNARSVVTASASELSRRWGRALGLRAIDTDPETYRQALRDLLTVVGEYGTSWHNIRRVAEILFGRSARLIKYDENLRYQCQLGNSLKLWNAGTNPSWDAYLTAGELMLEGRWLNVRRTDFAFAHASALHYVYIDGADPVDADENAKVQTSTTAISDETRTLLTGTFTFRRGETEVTTDTDLDEDLVQRHRRIAHGFSATDFVVDEIADARTLQLRYPYPEPDHVGLAWMITPNVVLGTVQTHVTSGIIDIESPGRLGRRTTRLISPAARGYGYELVLDADGTALEDATLQVRLLFELLSKLHPVHKRGYFRLRDDTQALVLGQPWPYGAQSSVDNSEILDDPAWFG